MATLRNEREYIKSIIKDVHRNIDDNAVCDSETSIWLWFSVLDIVAVYLLRNPEDNWIGDMNKALVAKLKDYFPKDYLMHFGFDTCSELNIQVSPLAHHD